MSYESNALSRPELSEIIECDNLNHLSKELQKDIIILLANTDIQPLMKTKLISILEETYDQGKKDGNCICS